jgi:hypothetical protein
MMSLDLFTCFVIRLKVPLCPVQAAEKAILNYRVPLLNETLPKLPALVANTTVGKFAQALVNDASVRCLAHSSIIRQDGLTQS